MWKTRLIGGVVGGSDTVCRLSGTGTVSFLVRASRYWHELTLLERALFPSSKLLEAYTIPPKMRPVERSTTKEQRRRSRDVSLSLGDVGEVLPTDPVFILRRVGPRLLVARTMTPGTLQHQQQRQHASPDVTPRASSGSMNPKSPQEIIAAQRAASRATQEALISAQENQSRGVDVVLRDKGTIRSSRLLEPNGVDYMRYSYIDDDGETYDISELLEAEWGQEAAESPETFSPPTLTRQATDQSVYVTAPSTPMEGFERPILGGPPMPRPSSMASGSQDLLHTVLQRSAGQPDARLEEKLARVIDKAKAGSIKSSTSMDSVEAIRPVVTSSAMGGRTTPTNDGRSTPSYPQTQSGYASGRTTPQAKPLSPLPEGREADLTPRSSSRQNYHNTAATVNRIISRHRQQPSIASIMSDLSAPNHHGDDEEQDSPQTATSSTHPTPPSSRNGGIYRRAVSTSPSPTPRVPIAYSDDFGIKALLATVEARARDMGPVRKVQLRESDEVERYLVGDKVDMETVHPEIRGCFTGVQSRLDRFDEDVDDLLALVGRRKASA
jgi:hypothetical protein